MSVCKSVRCAASGQITCRPLWHLCSLPALSPSPFWRQSLHRFLSFQVSFAYFWISCKWNQIVVTFSKSGFVAKPNLGPLAHMQLKPLRVWWRNLLHLLQAPRKKSRGQSPELLMVFREALLKARWRRVVADLWSALSLCTVLWLVDGEITGWYQQGLTSSSFRL